jgi:glutathione S-transferase
VEQCDEAFSQFGAKDGRVAIATLCEALGTPSQQQEKKEIFFDMIHSNNAARVRIWLMLKEGMESLVETRMLDYPDLKKEAFLQVNPLGKVPALIRSDGVTVFESPVILEYLEDKYWNRSPSFKPKTPEGRQLMNLMLRIHDLYIASPNCTAPGFSHSQGAMYLSYGWHGAVRGMDLKRRADKIAEIWKQMKWMNENTVGPYLCGDSLTLADMTWFPTTIFMEFMLPRVFGWPDIFRDGQTFPAISSWWLKISEEPAFKLVREQIYTYWEAMEAKGQFKFIIDEIAADKDGLKFKYP